MNHRFGILVFTISLIVIAVFSCNESSDRTPYGQAVNCIHTADFAGIKTLIGVDPTLVLKKENYDKRTLLHTVFSKGFFDSDARKMANLLIGAGSDVDAADDRGMTPAHCACFYGRDGAEALTYLVAKGAAVTLKDNSGKTPQDLLNSK